MTNNNSDSPDNDMVEDYFLTTLENGSLVMEPFCRCGEMLDDTYHCQACGRDCRCMTFVCPDVETLAEIQRFIESQPRFSKFKARLVP